jgi:hypothetical protein
VCRTAMLVSSPAAGKWEAILRKVVAPILVSDQMAKHGTGRMKSLSSRVVALTSFLYAVLGFDPLLAQGAAAVITARLLGPLRARS